jgi:predicted AlkP superfamily pyrophosphatase or phosphodiesterase
MRSARQLLYAFTGLAVIVILVNILAATTFAAEPGPVPQCPRLVVLVVFDQLRGDYLTRWEPHFGEGGFRRLQKEGAWYQDCHYPYAGTLTGAGHASLLTGCSPAKHGIVANEWHDRATGEMLNCVRSLRYARVPPLPPEGEKRPNKKDRGNVSPELLKAASFGDVLKEATAGKAHIVSLSLKDRSAILPAGRKPDACYWLDTDTGMFVTSTYYRDKLQPWVEEFNHEHPADTWFDKEWTRFRADLDYDKVVGPDDVVGEGTGIKQGRTFPHPMNGGLDKPGPAYYQAIYNSPFGNDLLVALAKQAIDAEKLGTHDAPDLLCVSFSSNDAVGHCWGPDSQEVFDITLRSDVIVKELLSHLDARVGKGRYLLALTADHGVCPIPEVARAREKDAGRVSGELLRRGADELLEATFGNGGEDKPRWIEAVANGWVFLSPATLRDRDVPPAQAERSLAEWLRKQAGVYTAYTRTELKRGLAEEDAIGQRVLQSYYPERCGDVLIVLKPNWLMTSTFQTGTTHGSPYGYDTHVPLLIYGPNVAAGVRRERIAPMAIASIFAQALGTKPPPAADNPVPKGLFTAR